MAHVRFFHTTKKKSEYLTYLLCLNDKGERIEERVIHWLLLVRVGGWRERDGVR